MANKVPFNQRLGLDLKLPLDKEVPESARIGFVHLLNDLVSDHYVLYWDKITQEVLRTSRKLRGDFDDYLNNDALCATIVAQMSWDKFYILCERVYGLIQPKHEWLEGDEYFVKVGTLADAQSHYAEEVNQLLFEENLAYEFIDGYFQRRGRPQTQKTLMRAGAVLSDPQYLPARKHFNKALDFFNERPDPDIQNCIKEAVCCLEAVAEILFGEKAAKDFDAAIVSKQGNAEGQIPPTIASGIIKLRAFRGNAQGVAHAALEGGFVGIVEAELVLSLVASYVTYLNDRFPRKEEEIPF